METLIPDNRTTSCKRCLRSLIMPNLGMMHRISKPLSFAFIASLFTISEYSVSSRYGDISLAMNKILFFADMLEAFSVRIFKVRKVSHFIGNLTCERHLTN